MTSLRLGSRRFVFGDNTRCSVQGSRHVTYACAATLKSHLSAANPRKVVIIAHYRVHTAPLIVRLRKVEATKRPLSAPTTGFVLPSHGDDEHSHCTLMGHDRDDILIRQLRCRFDHGKYRPVIMVEKMTACRSTAENTIVKKSIELRIAV